MIQLILTKKYFFISLRNTFTLFLKINLLKKTKTIFTQETTLTSNERTELNDSNGLDNFSSKIQNDKPEDEDFSVLATRTNNVR